MAVEIKFFFEFSLLALEVFLICFTTENIDFRRYIYFLMVGRQQEQLYDAASIFLVRIPKNARFNSRMSYESIDNVEEGSSLLQTHQRLIDNYDNEAGDNNDLNSQLMNSNYSSYYKEKLSSSNRLYNKLNTNT